MAFDLLLELRPRARRATVCVRVSRKWEYRGGTDDGPIQHVDLVLIDVKGNSMYGEIPGSKIESKSHLIQEGGVYIIGRFRVSNAKHSFRPVDSPYMVEFTCHTQITPREDMPGLPLYAYRLIPIDELKSRAGDTRDFVDTIGLLTEVSDSLMVRLPNKPQPTLTRHIMLRDLSYSEIKVSLWAERAAAFIIDGVHQPAEGKPMVVLLVGGLMKKYQDNYYLSANTAARWYFNPQIPEAKEFYNSFQEQHVDIKQVAAPVQPDNRPRAPAELETKTLLDLNGMDPYDYSDDGYRCTVTVGRLVPNASWWLASCTRCSKSCAQDGAGYRCNSCSSTSFRFKYKICFVALDGTDEAEMICFGDVARHIVGKPVQQVLRMTNSANPVPADIAKIVSRRFTFTVILTQQSYYRQEKTFQVTSVIASLGQRDPAPVAAQNGSATPPNGSSSHALLHKAAVHEAVLSPASVLGTAGSPPVADSTPPPVLCDSGASPVKGQREEGLEGKTRPSARRKLPFGEDDDEVPVTPSAKDNFNGQDDADDQSGEAMDGEALPVFTEEVLQPAKGGEKKRTRALRGAAHQTA